MNRINTLILSRIPGWIRMIPENERDEAELEHDELIGCIRDAEKQRHEEFVETRKAIRAWKEDQKGFAKEARMRYLKEQNKRTLEMFQANKDRYVEVRSKEPDGLEIYFLAKEAKILIKRIKSYEIEMEYLEGGKQEDITQEMIERAREYPIKNILEVDSHGRARCIFHDGQNKNMDTRKNFAFCHVCGKHGDAIDVYRARTRCGFTEAVMALQH